MSFSFEQMVSAFRFKAMRQGDETMGTGSVRAHKTDGNRKPALRQGVSDTTPNRFQKDSIFQQTDEGSETARPQKRKSAIKPVLTKNQVMFAQAAITYRSLSISAIADKLGIKPVTLYRYVGPSGQLRERGRKVLAG